jgi:hypothetical protein
VIEASDFLHIRWLSRASVLIARIETNKLQALSFY